MSKFEVMCPWWKCAEFLPRRYAGRTAHVARTHTMSSVLLPRIRGSRATDRFYDMTTSVLHHPLSAYLMSCVH